MSYQISKAAAEKAKETLKILGSGFKFYTMPDPRHSYMGVFMTHRNGTDHHVGVKPSQLKDIPAEALAHRVQDVAQRLINGN